jgi:hypothetical protein
MTFLYIHTCMHTYISRLGEADEKRPFPAWLEYDMPIGICSPHYSSQVFMCACVYVHFCVCECICISLPVHTNAQIVIMHIGICSPHFSSHVYIYACVYVHQCMCICASMHVYMCINACMCSCIYAHTFTNTGPPGQHQFLMTMHTE